MDDQLIPYIKLLGREARDRVTHLAGTVTCISFDLYGCIQAILQPRVDKNGKIPEGRWLDVGRLHTEVARALPVPDFAPHHPTLTILGRWGHDEVTGFEGTISSVALHLSGRTEIALSPRIDEDGKIPEGRWISTQHVTLVGNQRAMDPPAFAQLPATLPAAPQDYDHGPAEKPAMNQGPQI